MQKSAWVAIRKNTEDGKEWMDLSTVSPADWWTKLLADKGEKKSPKFCKVNPVHKIIMVTIATTEG